MHVRPSREVVSYGRRDGRSSRRKALAESPEIAAYVVTPPRAGRDTSVAPSWRLDPVELFGRAAPLVVEVGSGGGDALVAGALADPGRDFLGIEVYRPGIAQTVVRAHRAGVTNLRVVDGDAATVLARSLPAHCASEVWVFFPDPWPKARHHKRRLIQPSTMHLFARVLAPGGVLRAATDWDHYATAMVQAGRSSAEFENPLGGFAPRYAPRPVTRFERKGLELGREIHDLTFVRRPVR